MKSQNELNRQIYERAVRWTRECLEVTRRKTAAMTQNDRAALEDCVEEEARLAAQWPEVAAAKRFAGREADREVRQMALDTLRPLVTEIRSLNRTNAVLAQSGFDFSETLLSVIRPAPTYGAGADGEAKLIRPMQPTISLKC